MGANARSVAPLAAVTNYVSDTDDGTYMSPPQSHGKQKLEAMQRAAAP